MFSESAITKTSNTKYNINLKQKTFSGQFEGLPLTKLVSSIEQDVTYSADQVKLKLENTKWPSSKHLLNFYEANRDIFNFKEAKKDDSQHIEKIDALYSQFLESL